MLRCLGGRKGSDYLPIVSCCPRPCVGLVESTENIAATAAAAVGRRGGNGHCVAHGGGRSSYYCVALDGLRHFKLSCSRRILSNVWLCECKPAAISRSGRKSGVLRHIMRDRRHLTRRCPAPASASRRCRHRMRPASASGRCRIPLKGNAT